MLQSSSFFFRLFSFSVLSLLFSSFYLLVSPSPSPISVPAPPTKILLFLLLLLYYQQLPHPLLLQPPQIRISSFPMAFSGVLFTLMVLLLTTSSLWVLTGAASTPSPLLVYPPSLFTSLDIPLTNASGFLASNPLTPSTPPPTRSFPIGAMAESIPWW